MALHISIFSFFDCFVWWGVFFLFFVCFCLFVFGLVLLLLLLLPGTGKRKEWGVAKDQTQDLLHSTTKLHPSPMYFRFKFISDALER